MSGPTGKLSVFNPKIITCESSKSVSAGHSGRRRYTINFHKYSVGFSRTLLPMKIENQMLPAIYEVFAFNNAIVRNGRCCPQIIVDKCETFPRKYLIFATVGHNLRLEPSFEYEPNQLFNFINFNLSLI